MIGGSLILFTYFGGKRRSRNNISGQGALAFVFLVGSAIILLGITLAFLAISFLRTSAGFQAANRALAVASSGAEDVLIQLARGRIFCVITPPSNSCNYSYSVPIGDDVAEVTIERDSDTGYTTVNSSAILSGIDAGRRKIRMVVSVASSTGEVSVLSWEQVAF